MNRSAKISLAVSVLVFGVCEVSPALAVEVGTTYQTAAPTSADIPNWNTGWGNADVTGWNYVGQIDGGASGTYLGNGWVLTAAHVGAGTFDLDGNSFAAIAGTAQSFGSVDLSLFRINTTATNNQTILNLPTLLLSTSAPTPFDGVSGSSVAMMGYGGGSESWGLNTVTQINQAVSLTGSSYLTNDFLTLTGSTLVNGHTVANDAMLVGGDSGGGDFIRNPATGLWELAGINEAVGTTAQGQQLSAFVQLDGYASQIEADMNPVPLPATGWLFLSGLGALGWIARREPKVGATCSRRNVS